MPDKTDSKVQTIENYLKLEADTYFDSVIWDSFLFWLENPRPDLTSLVGTQTFQLLDEKKGLEEEKEEEEEDDGQDQVGSGSGSGTKLGV